MVKLASLVAAVCCLLQLCSAAPYLDFAELEEYAQKGVVEMSSLAFEEEEEQELNKANEQAESLVSEDAENDALQLRSTEPTTDPTGGQDDARFAMLLDHLMEQAANKGLTDDSDNQMTMNEVIQGAGKSFTKDKSYWKSLYNGVTGSDRWTTMKENGVMYVRKCKAYLDNGKSGEKKAYDREEDNYGRVLVTKDEGNRLWIVFAGSNGDQVKYGIKGQYITYDGVSHGKVHQNFYLEWEAIKGDVISYITSNKQNNVLFTGHSKGGVHALLAAYELTQVEHTVDSGNTEVLVFGSPNPGNKQVSRAVGTVNYDKAKFFLAWIKGSCKGRGLRGKFWDIVSAKNFKLKTKSSNGFKKNKKYRPRGLNYSADFYFPLVAPAFRKIDLRAQRVGCGTLGFASGLVSDLSKDASNDYQILMRAWAHQTSRYLSGLNAQDA